MPLIPATRNQLERDGNAVKALSNDLVCILCWSATCVIHHSTRSKGLMLTDSMSSSARYHQADHFEQYVSSSRSFSVSDMSDTRLPRVSARTYQQCLLPFANKPKPCFVGTSTRRSPMEGLWDRVPAFTVPSDCHSTTLSVLAPFGFRETDRNVHQLRLPCDNRHG